MPGNNSIRHDLLTCFYFKCYMSRPSAGSQGQASDCGLLQVASRNQFAYQLCMPGVARAAMLLELLRLRLEPYISCSSFMERDDWALENYAFSCQAVPISKPLACLHSVLSSKRARGKVVTS